MTELNKVRIINKIVGDLDHLPVNNDNIIYVNSMRTKLKFKCTYVITSNALVSTVKDILKSYFKKRNFIHEINSVHTYYTYENYPKVLDIILNSDDSITIIIKAKLKYKFGKIYSI